MRVCGIGKAFGDEPVLADVSFEVESGEILGLIGPNGAGKTTLLECIAGLLPSVAGEVQWRSTSLPPARRKEQLFYVPEAISPYPDQTTMEVLKFFRETYRQARPVVSPTPSAVQTQYPRRRSRSSSGSNIGMFSRPSTIWSVHPAV